MTLQLWNLDSSAYARHPLHCGDRAWPESNCYVDLWIELLHAAGAEPLAALACALAVDVEGDQWTFFKFPLGRPRSALRRERVRAERVAAPGAPHG